MPGHARPFIGRQRAQALLAQQVVMRRDGLAAFVLRLAQRRAAASRRESSSARASGRRWSCNHSCAAQGWARRQGRGGRLPARSAWTPCPARRACRARRARALPVRPGPVAPSAPPGGPPARDGYRHGWSDGTGPDAARSAPRPGHVDWPASHPPPAGPGARVVPWPRRRRTSWMRIRAGHAPADRSPSGHPTRTPRRRPARIPRRPGTRIRARNPGWLPGSVARASS